MKYHSNMKPLLASQIQGEENIHLQRVAERYPDSGIYAVSGQIVKILGFMECPIKEKTFIHAQLDNGECVPIYKIQIL